MNKFEALLAVILGFLFLILLCVAGVFLVIYLIQLFAAYFSVSS